MAKSGHVGRGQARYELQGLAGKLRGGRKEDERAPVAVDHDEHNSGEVAFMAVAADQPNATSTLGSPAQQQGVRARGSYGGAIGRSWLATVPRRARRSKGGAAAVLWASGGNEEEAERVRVSGEATGRAPVQASQRAAWSGRARRMVATRRQRPAAGRHCSADSVRSTEQLNRPDSETCRQKIS